MFIATLNAILSKNYQVKMKQQQKQHQEKDEQEEAKGMTWKEIRKIAPGYRGKKADFNPAKVRSEPKPSTSKPKPVITAKPKETKFKELNDAKPTPQKNEPIWADAISVSMYH